MSEFLSAFLQHRNREDEFTVLFSEAQDQEDYLVWISENLATTLPERRDLMRFSVFEMALEGIRHIIQPESHDLFLQFFLDFVYEKKPLFHSLEEFLILWEEKSKGLHLVMPEGMDAIQVMTAHKAKGLKFGVVIADLYNNNNKLTQEKFWAPVAFPEVDKLDKALLKISKELELIGMEDVHAYESSKTKLDFLNLVYVAFTRPVDGLYILCHQCEKNGDDFSLQVQHFLETQGLWDAGQEVYSFGDLKSVPVSEKEATAGETTTEAVPFPTAPWYEHMVMAPVEESYWEALEKTAPRVYGNLIHDMLSRIRRAADVDRVIQQYESSGLIDASETITIRTQLEKVVRHPEVAPFFREDVQVKTETEVWDAEQNKMLRPDRVVLGDRKLTLLDYKTGEKKKAHEKQMEAYAGVFTQMGYATVEKLLIYLNEEVEVVSV